MNNQFAITIVMLVLLCLGYMYIFKKQDVPVPRHIKPEILLSGDSVRFESQASFLGKSVKYLSTCGQAHSPEYHCGLAATVRQDADTGEEGTARSQRIWQINSTSKLKGTPVMYGDTVSIKSMSKILGGNLFLSPCGELIDDCGVYVTLREDDVYSAEDKTRDWKIVGGVQGQIVSIGQIVQFLSEAKIDRATDYYMSPCIDSETNHQSVCGTAVTLMSDTTWPDGRQDWRVLKPKV
jgi:hypothetical protein